MDQTTPPQTELARRAVSRAIPALSIVILAVMGLSLALRTSGQGIAPNYDDGGSAITISVAIGLVCFGLMLATAARETKRPLFALGWSLLVTFFSFPTMLIVFDEAHQRADFAGSRISEYQEYLSINFAQIHRGRGVHYEVGLTGRSGLLNIDERDYRAAFGSAERVKPVGYCVLATVQTAPITVDNGPNMPISARRRAVAVRVVNGFALPAGRLVRCPWVRPATLPTKK
ncbi:hypothetical protein FPZ24_04955 [Sphingomonas panacisoli]|uniref:Uncharacterized protein n=1 Tax=Sphingomonas panacisoli TaxID=1813879 RepID=A0A5B8LG65_9SPHN|nr:hypothetical protein [Sphingomonas panacisoli]QDZ06909.1 hypothetical protein FPZ24_04955 [Sphingomonas panacisoli]